ncbi:hypothetical protein QYZ88_015100 [Lachnospiraceae bacterium C1.1]|nr:hypothetical protein [Lachnospiraceae bacterium C1.1]
MHALKKLSEIIGVSGYEEFVSKEIEDILCNNPQIIIKRDRIGNLICHIEGDIASPRVMIISHMDEVGFQVMKIDDLGRASLKTLGNIKSWNILNQRLVSTLGDKKGIVFCEDPEDIKAHDIGKISVIPTSGIFRVGDVLSFDTEFIDTDDFVIGKALDNRVSCYILCDILKRSKRFNNSIDVVFSVQEEIGMRGARVAITELMPDVVIDLDVSPVGERNSLKLGEGVGIKISDSIGVSSNLLVKRFEELAIGHSIKYQYEVSDCGTSELIITNEKDIGAERVGISIPCQNIHSSLTMIKKTDLRACTNLINAFINDGIYLD